MATIAGNSHPLEFNFIDNPIMVGVTNLTFPAGATFRQAMVQVDVTPTYSGAVTSTYYFYADASATTLYSTVWIDISTALRAAMNSWSADAATVIAAGTKYAYPYATFGTTVFEKYLLDGSVHQHEGASQSGAYAYYGGLSEYERFTLSNHPADFLVSAGNNKYLSRKPRTQGEGEVLETGAVRAYSYYLDGTVYTSSYTLTDTNEGKEGYDGGGYFWQLPVSGERRLFAFVNSLGVLETVMAQSRESLAYGIESEVKNLASTPAYKAKPNITTHKTGGRPKLEMSSGKVSRDWADWWATEFLMAKRYWMLTDTGVWLPVTVSPADDEVLIYDRSDSALPHVDFDVEVAVSGSLKNQIKP